MSLFEALALDYFEGRKLFCQRYGSGLRFLINRKCGGKDSETCFEAIVDASLVASSSGDVTDAAIPALVHRIFRRITADVSEASVEGALQTRGAQIKLEQRTINLIQQRLALFSATQREALYRFYVGEETATAICDDLKLLPDQFDFVRSVLKSVVNLEMDFATLRNPRRLFILLLAVLRSEIAFSEADVPRFSQPFITEDSKTAANPFGVR